MKKLLIIGLLLSSLIYGAYYQYGIFTDINYFTAKSDIKNGNIQILTFGLTAVPDSILNIAAKEYGFKIVRVADCNVTQRFINQVDSYNDAVVDYLNNKHEQGWIDEYEKRIEELNSVVY